MTLRCTSQLLNKIGPERYINTSITTPDGTDRRLYYAGTFLGCVEGWPLGVAHRAGEIVVSYDVELITPAVHSELTDQTVIDESG